MKKTTVKLTEGDLRDIVKESVTRLLKEYYQSSRLKQWAKSHGGVIKKYEPDNKHTRFVQQDSLGDITDDQILYFQEFPSYQEASDEKFRLKNNGQYGKRSDWDMKAFFIIFTANDGTALLVGVDRNTFETTPTWGGERSKKLGDRVWRGKTSDQLKDTYFYHKKADSVGVSNNRDFKNLRDRNNELRQKMSPEEWDEYMKGVNKDRQDYIDRNFPR